MTGKTTKSNTKNVLRTLLAAAALSVAFAAPAAADTGPGGLAATGGCIHQCIERALVTTTTTSAVEIETDVRTKVVVTARRLSSAGRIDGSAIKAFARSLVKARTLYPYDLQPERAYRITVSATDADGHTATRSGMFKTQKPQTT